MSPPTMGAILPLLVLRRLVAIRTECISVRDGVYCFFHSDFIILPPLAALLPPSRHPPVALSLVLDQEITT